MATPGTKLPPDIARKIAAMGKVAPAGAPAVVRPVEPRPAPAAGGASSAMMLGWLVALAAIGVAVGEYYWFQMQQKAALAEQAQGYEQEIEKLRAESAAQLKKVADDAAASQMSLQAELDFQKMPEIPLETIFRANQVLFVSNNSKDPFGCKVRLFRPIGGVSRELDFSMRGGGYQDIAAIEDWMFQKGDKVEFVKSGYKPRALVVP